MGRRRYLSFALWLGLTTVWVGVCLFLTWQTGEGTGQLSLIITRWILKLLAAVGIRPEEGSFHMVLRKCAHFGVFFVAGFLACGTTEAFLRLIHGGGWIRLASGATVTALALFADVPKLWIPGRHLTWSESAMNAAGALAGFLTMLLAALVLGKIRSRRADGRTPDGVGK